MWADLSSRSSKVVRPVDMKFALKVPTNCQSVFLRRVQVFDRSINHMKRHPIILIRRTEGIEETGTFEDTSSHSSKLSKVHRQQETDGVIHGKSAV
jgi:hypothetical protein